MCVNKLRVILNLWIGHSTLYTLAFPHTAELSFHTQRIHFYSQLVNIFKSRFKSNIAILHSALSDGEKYDEWRKIKEGKVSLVIGTRSAIFAPLSNIGLIIIDEEHEDTYKQENNPRYKAIDIALERAKYNNAKILLFIFTLLMMYAVIGIIYNVAMHDVLVQLIIILGECLHTKRKTEHLHLQLLRYLDCHIYQNSNLRLLHNCKMMILDK